MIDLLYKTGEKNRFRVLPRETVKDIALQEVIDYMSGDQEERKILLDVMSKIPSEPSDIIYRQEITRDLIENTSLYEAVKKSIGAIKVLSFYGTGAKRIRDKDNSLASLLEELRELKVWVEVVETLFDALNGNDIKSEGLTALRDALKEITEDEDFKSVKPDIKKIHDDLSNVRGAVVGVTLTADMDIENVTAIEFVDYKPRSSYTIMDVAVGSKIRNPFNDYKYQDPLLVSMTPFMKKHLGRHFGEVKNLIRKHSKYDSRILTNLYSGLVFYLNAAELAERLAEKKYVTSFPEIVENNGIEIRGLYNIRLAVKAESEIVTNDFDFTDNEKIFILTGPNRGGKTIIEQGLGLISVMASLGMVVTADSFKGIPFGNILTHFPIDENLTINYGRLGEEAVRIKDIVRDSDSNTLILFNETFSTTSAADALYLSKDLLHILKDKGSSVIFNTHIHELAACIPEMNSWEGDSRIVSIIMEIKDNRNTFKVRRSSPDTSSYARNIAEKYGITYEQLKGE
ncbi:MAG: hypothetical protein K5779_03310 [Saccharofermentans sp.]|nr:hypothetical protein [Saccharofermentans sp.]